MSAYEIKTLFKAADENQDGEISKGEWEILVSKMMKDGTAESTKKLKKKTMKSCNPNRVRG
jgi:Ca2+-binding EF-hand superfamily protein